MSSRVSSLSLAVALAAVVLVSSGCGRARAAGSVPAPTRAAASKPGEINGTGTLESEQAVSLAFRVPGRIQEVRADQGDRVTAGQVLARLQADEATQEVGVATAAHQASVAAVAKTEADVRQLQASLDVATKERDRMRALVRDGVVSTATLDSAEATWLEGQARVEAAVAAQRQAQSAVTQAARVRDLRGVTLVDQEVRSPVDGLVLRRHQEQGDVVSPGTPVFTVVSTRKLWVRAWVDETALGRLREGQQTRVVFRSEPERSYRGRVDRIGHESDRQTHELLVDIEVLERPARLAVGQRADVFIQSEPRS
jgi:RND family efflux transporter MFP subunit